MDNKTTEPQYKFDGYVLTPDGQRFACDIQIWLPSGPDQDASIAVFTNGIAGAGVAHGGISLISSEAVEGLGLKFSAEDVFVSNTRSQMGYRGGGAELTVSHVGNWVIEHVNARFRAEDEPLLQAVAVSLSPLAYGARSAGECVSYEGGREIKFFEPAKSLRFASAAGDAFTWTVEQHWTWKSPGKNSVSAFATPTLCLASPPRPLTELDLPQLKACAKDSCTLLTLAARHRVAAHVFSYVLRGARTQDWEYPLERLRSRTKEDATGPLVAPAELESYFETAWKWWSSLDEERRDAVRLAVFTVHSTTSATLENQFMSRFAALEGLAKRWGRGSTAGGRFDFMAATYGITAAGLWPMYDKAGGQPLYWLRNVIAHGRSATIILGALPLAADHLQLWIEKVLLRLMGFDRQDKSDWLTREVPRQYQELSQLRSRLNVADSGTALP